MVSKDRVYLDHCWQALGIDPRDERAQQIESLCVVAHLREMAVNLKEMRRVYVASEKLKRG